PVRGAIGEPLGSGGGDTRVAKWRHGRGTRFAASRLSLEGRRSMRRFLASFAVALGLVASGSVAAQQPAPPPQAAPEQSVTPPSEEDIEKFADIYIDLRATAQK